MGPAGDCSEVRLPLASRPYAVKLPSGRVRLARRPAASNLNPHGFCKGSVIVLRNPSLPYPKTVVRGGSFGVGTEGALVIECSWPCCRAKLIDDANPATWNCVVRPCASRTLVLIR